MKASERSALYAMFGGLCAYCGQPLGQRWHADHVDPVLRELRFADGKVTTTGKFLRPQNDRPDNMVPACVPCNLDKSSLPIEAWRTKLARACDVLRRNQPTYRHALRFGLVLETTTPIVFHYERLAGERA